MFCSATIEIGHNMKKELRNRPKSARIKLPHSIQMKENLSLNVIIVNKIIDKPTLKKSLVSVN